MTRTDLYNAMVNLCHGYGHPTAETVEALDRAIDTIALEPEDDDR